MYSSILSLVSDRYILAPAQCNSVPEAYYERVRLMHEKGGFGSIGHGQGTFTREETLKNLLRTHTTAISAQMLYKLANVIFERTKITMSFLYV